jgi:hypothetical protein
MSDENGKSVVARLNNVWLAWFCVYMVTGAYAMMQNRTSFFAGTLDYIESLWIKLFFLNIPLQIVLALVAFQLNKSSQIGMRKVGAVVAMINTGLIVLHILISVLVHFTR